MTLRNLLTTACLTICATTAAAAVSIDINLTTLRSLPEAAEVRTRIDAALPESATQRLATLEALCGFDPRRDLSRVVVEIQDTGLPSARLVGLPATAIADQLAKGSAGKLTPAGVTAYALPRRPQILLVPLGEHEALIGHRAQMESLAATPAALAPVTDLVLVAHIVPGPHPHFAAMTLVADAQVRVSGTGTLAATVQAKDVAAAEELERRIVALRALVSQGAAQGLPEMAERAQILASLTVVRQAATLELHAIVPPALRATMIERMIDRIVQRMTKV